MSKTMMAEELLRMRRREPFQPFRVYDTNGEKYDVLNPEEVMVTDFVVVLPVRVPDPNDPDAGYPALVELDQVDRIESLSLWPLTDGPDREDSGACS